MKNNLKLSIYHYLLQKGSCGASFSNIMKNLPFSSVYCSSVFYALKSLKRDGLIVQRKDKKWMLLN